MIENKALIIKQAIKIKPLLSFLIQPEPEAEKIANELTKLLKLAEDTLDNDSIIKQILDLLNKHDSTKNWMDIHLSSEASSGATRGRDNLFNTDKNKPHLYPVWFGTNREPTCYKPYFNKSLSSIG